MSWLIFSVADQRYLEDFEPGQTFGSGRVGIDAAGIKRFAAELDPQPFHLDEGAALNSIFRSLAASGWHTAAITMKRTTTLNQNNEPVQVSVGNLTCFVAPRTNR